MSLSRLLNNAGTVSVSIPHQIKPAVATAGAAVTVAGEAAVWQNVIQGWAALITVVIGVPTALIILSYWLLRLRKAWKHRNDDTDI